jgi:hypothetical protein
MERILAVFLRNGSEASMADAIESPVRIFSMREAFDRFCHKLLAFAHTMGQQLGVQPT